MATADTKKMKEIEEIIKEHIRESCENETSRDEKLDKLMPLVDLIPAIQQLVEDRKTSIAVNERFAYIARVILTIGGVIGAIFAIVQLIFKLGKPL